MKETSILIDGNNHFVRNFFTAPVGGKTEDPDWNLWKFLSFEQIYNILHRYNNVKEIIIAIDGGEPWRKLYFKNYKYKRKEVRDKSDVDWDKFFIQYEEFHSYIKSSIPFKVIKINKCEADDIIAVLSKVIENNVIIFSGDGDFKQLLNNKNVKLYNPRDNEYITCNDTEHWIQYNCLVGQPKDSIFNIKTPWDWDVESDKRKPGFGEKSAEKVFDIGLEKWLNENNLKERYEQNRNLIDFNRIPKIVDKTIQKVYNDYKLPSPDKIIPFFMNTTWRSFIDDIHNVERKLLSLY